MIHGRSVQDVEVIRERAVPEPPPPPRNETTTRGEPPEHIRQQLARESFPQQYNEWQKEQQVRKWFRSLAWEGKLIAVVAYFVAWASFKVNAKANWLRANAANASSFIRTHLRGPVAPWTIKKRRKECKTCIRNAGGFCESSTCNCGRWYFSSLKHITRLSGVHCPLGKWDRGVVGRIGKPPMVTVDEDKGNAEHRMDRSG